MQDANSSTKCLLNPGAGQAKFQMSYRFPTTQDIAFLVERYWIVDWDLNQEGPYVQQNIPHPSVNLILEQRKSRVVGVVQGRFSTVLSGKGRVFGVKFRVGAFYPFLKSTVSAIRGSSIPASSVFGPAADCMERMVLRAGCQQRMVDIVESLLRERLPERDDNVTLVGTIVDRIVADRELTKVESLVEEFKITTRGLQRLFSKYVGASPKWVIKRYRLQEAAHRITQEQPKNLSDMALQLGYFDQAHFLKDFKGIIGQSPSEYARTQLLAMEERRPSGPPALRKIQNAR